MNSLTFRTLRDRFEHFNRQKNWLAFLIFVLFLRASGQAEQLTLSTIAGTNAAGILDGTNRAAQFWAPAAVACSGVGNLFVADGNAVRRLTLFNTNWVVTTIAGVIKSHGPDDGTNLSARFNQPEGIAVDSLTNLFVADTANNSIRRIASLGTNWVVSTVAGVSAFTGGFADGTNSVARFNQPYGILASSSGALFIADTFNHTIRKIVTVGTNNIVTTIAGAVASAATTDGTNSNAHFNAPLALTEDSSGNVYVADFADFCIRKMTPVGTNWSVTTIAGQPGFSGVVDGTNKAARFEGPTSVAVDAYGRIYVSDGVANVIRKIKNIGTNYIVTTVAGTAGTTGTNDGVGPAVALDSPVGISLDGAGGIFIVDGMNFTVRLGRVAALLELTRLNNQLTLSWPVDHADFTLYSRGSIAGGNWSSISSGWVTNGDTCVYMPPIPSGSAYYRLQKP